MDLHHRPRRNRKSESVRALCQETSLHPSDLILPVFFHSESTDHPIESMPGCTRWSLTGLADEAKRAFELGIPAMVLFPKVDEALKSSDGRAAASDDGIVSKAIATIRDAVPEMSIITDVALDPYSSDGHDGVVEQQPNGDLKILNDETVEVLCEQALCHARAGADIVSPSDMMDGRVGAIREALDTHGFQDVNILSYSAKYASAYYGPFRGALDSAPKAGDKKTYQMDPANRREALREVALDVSEGADMVMVKPAGPYLDIIREVRNEVQLPVAAYQVSGEYLMIKSAAAAGWVDEDKIIVESLMGIKRAGADMILTYFAKEACELIS